ncbi:glutaredoxin family protein [Bacillus pinisoli]|uniref:glutaredoxin family protein n=1 Tax=Bacillus pinisoli TaxID=2901866 RepID=UPI001FF4366A|nr:glutaredoxin family protein [Bacillus pinisoli]
MKEYVLTFYTKENCPLCEKAKAVIEELSEEFPLKMIEKDIYKDDQLLELYQLMIPVLELNGEQIGYGLIRKDEVRSELTRLISH